MEHFHIFVDVFPHTCVQKGHLQNTGGDFTHTWVQKGHSQNIGGVFVHTWVQKGHL